MSSKSCDDRNHWWLITPASKRSGSLSGRNCWFYTKSIGFRFSEAISGGDRFGSQNKLAQRKRNDKYSKRLYSLLGPNFKQYLSHSPVYRFIYSMMRFPLFEPEIDTRSDTTIYSAHFYALGDNEMAFERNQYSFASHNLSGVWPPLWVPRFFSSSLFLRKTKRYTVVLSTCIRSSQRARCIERTDWDKRQRFHLYQFHCGRICRRHSPRSSSSKVFFPLLATCP